ncbi:MAG: MBL fold metallo-hydrolase RNA specificity domain-containing protein [Desulfurispora sp.]|uniref:MBL fold metallo-hydrolase RNA specificity domain-containing protein n=1 Tax=Desulfurispora sp. TaxID=3014275 RepID=UPI00404AD62F
MQITFYGAAGTVTGSCYLLETGQSRVLVDCGMFQGPRAIRERNYGRFPFLPATVDAVLLTHAHIDHSGLLPKLVKHGFRKNIYATAATTDLCAVMLSDSGHIQEMEVERLNRKNRRAGRALVEPIYTAEEVSACLENFVRVEYNQLVRVTPDVSVRFIDAGHILGSAMLEVYVYEGATQTKVLFTGDLGSRDKPFVRDPERVREADYVVMESTYGDRQHRDAGNRRQMLQLVAWETYRKGGNLVIPAFAVERTQDLLYDINLLVRAGQFPPMRVYIDSPMAVAATEVFKKYPHIFDEETRQLIARGENPLQLPGLTYTVSARESLELNKIKGGAVILSASGMCDAGRIKHHLKHNLWRPESTILFVGYQAQGTKGRRLLEGVKQIRIHGEDIAVRADIRQIDGYSSHADQEALLGWLGAFSAPPRQVFLVHGEPQAAQTLAGLIKERLGYTVHIPVWQETAALTPGLTVTAEQVRQLYELVAGKMQSLLQSGAASSTYADIARTLAQLNGLLETTTAP